MGPDDALRDRTTPPSDGARKLGRPQTDELTWIFFGPQGLRAGWSILLFVVLLYFLLQLFQVILSFLVLDIARLHVYGGTALSTILGEGDRVAALICAVLVVAALEHRHPVEYNLARSRQLVLLVSGAAAGFLALSVLIAALMAGGWLHFGPAGLAGIGIIKYALLWGVAFALVGIFEEGAFRCYLLATLARGVNFWWALAAVGAICLYLVASPGASGAGGIYIVAAAGLLPCFWLERSESPGRSFWQAAWASSVGFGFIHTFNRGENWLGILAAAVIGFVFCVSVYVTGSAWWAIGCHATWDWAESYFYGTADSGFYARGHLLTSIPAGPALWSGDGAGPEGSILVLPTILVLLAALFLLHGRHKAALVTGEQASFPEA
jgi:membrane protease YdiL (CAAX protease family)